MSNSRFNIHGKRTTQGVCMLKRKIEKDIKHWIESSDKALLLYGVRQAGKTFVIRHCLKESSADYIEFNLIENPN